MNQKIVFGISLLLLLVFATGFVQAAPTTEVHVIKYAENGTILGETTVTYQWIVENLPVQGDGITHYYHQGPVFEGDKWDPNETTNFKDKGAVMGTKIKDLCDLVGGMSPGDEVMIHAPDGYHIEFGYTNVYEPQPRQGPIVLCWHCSEDIKEIGERQGGGHPPDYSVGMRLVFFADISTNPDGKHVFGNWDMHECLPEQCYHFYELYPSTNGFSVKWVDELRIYGGGYTGEHGDPAKAMPTPTPASRSIPGFELVFALVGLVVVAFALLRRER